ncbi:MAG: serine/threonine-protein phosphatase [Gammaproteobacteria bacterium]|nr:serine/threonine-protein phosphatase [Gammaproteobacteria bacterium]
MPSDPAARLILSTATLSCAGGCADHQDACAVFANGQGGLCAVLANGLGGQHCGEQAAQQAIATVRAAFAQQAEPRSATVRRYLEAAHRAVQTRQQQHPELATMRTTAVTLLIDSGWATWAHSGDSRLYHFRAGAVAFQTRDHSVPQRLVGASDLHPSQIRYHQDRNQLLAALGEPGDLRLTTLPEPMALQAGDAFLLCSDGLWEPVTELEMIADRLKTATPAEWLELLEYRVLSRTLADHDHYSAVAVWIMDA